ncbi:hypothetical protein N6H14_33040 [Paenibacillus sp. CC-CFT747]|nr:hypothetical protein N6H14_33040 [Paenibacillus sp. CC-CFT747]
MRSLYSRVFLTTIIVVLASSLLGFLGANLYYHIKLKPYNDEKLIRVAEQLKQYLESHPDNPEEFLQESAALGYQLYWSDGRGNDRFYGRAFRVTDLPENAIRSVLKGNRYHGVADFPDKPFVTGFFDNRLSNTVGVPVFLGSRPYGLFLRPDVLLQFGELRLFSL